MGFPLNANDPYIKTTGERSTIGSELGNAGTQYVLPAATASTLGGIKVGAGLAITEDGTLSATAAPSSYVSSAQEVTT